MNKPYDHILFSLPEKEKLQKNQIYQYHLHFWVALTN